MKERALRVAGIVFLIMGLLQCLRLLLRIPVVAAGREVPLALSAVAALVMLGLAFWMFRVASRR
jgi:hypothetical protein